MISRSIKTCERRRSSLIGSSRSLKVKCSNLLTASWMMAVRLLTAARPLKATRLLRMATRLLAAARRQQTASARHLTTTQVSL